MCAAGRLVAGFSIPGLVVLAAAAWGGQRESPEQLLTAVRKARARKDYAQAERLARRILARHGEAVVAGDAHVELIEALYQQGRLTQAHHECDKFLKARAGSRHRLGVLGTLYEIGAALTRRRGRLLVVSYSRLSEGIAVLEKVVEHAPFGPKADDAICAIAQALQDHGRYEEARDHYNRLLANYPRSELRRAAIAGRAVCSARLVQGAPYDMKPAEEAEADFALLAREGAGEELAGKRRARMRQAQARAEYETGLYYFRKRKFEAGVRCMGAVIERYPESSFARRARRILARIDELRAAHSKEKP